MSFQRSFKKLRTEKKTVLCVGLDPALPQQRKEAVIPSRYLKVHEENEARLNFCLDIIDAVSESAIAVKPNQQYIFGFTKKQHQKLTGYSRKKDLLTVLDYKLNDIGDTVASAIFHLSEAGYDAITFNPLPGNLEETVKLAHRYGTMIRGRDLGIIVLTLMSNPEAEIFMKNAKVGKRALYNSIARQVRDFNADGCVVGATGHVSEVDIKTIRGIVGTEKVLLIPGVGTQKGDARKVLNVAGENVLINVGRDIIYSKNPKSKAQGYNKLFLSVSHG